MSTAACTVKDVVDNLERFYDAFDGEKKSVDTVLDRVDALVSPSVVVETSKGEQLDYQAFVQDLDTKLQSGWFMESAEVKQIDRTTIEYLIRIMMQGTMQTPRFRATIGDDFKIHRIVVCDVAEECEAGAPTVMTVTDDDNDTVLRDIKAELDQAAMEPETEHGGEDDVSTLGGSSYYH